MVAKTKTKKKVVAKPKRTHKTNRLIEIDLKEVYRLAKVGLNQQQVADALGISVDTLLRRKKSSAQFATALARGKAAGISKVVNALFDTAIEGSVPAQTFYLKNRAGWSDKIHQENTGESTVNTNIKVTFK